MNALECAESKEGFEMKLKLYIKRIKHTTVDDETLYITKTYYSQPSKPYTVV